MNTRAHGTSLIVGLYDGRPFFSDDCMYQGRLKDIHERLDRLSEFIVGLSDEGVEGISQASLADKLKCSAAHPFEYVETLRTVLQVRLDGSSQLESRGCHENRGQLVGNMDSPFQRHRRRGASSCACVLRRRRG